MAALVWFHRDLRVRDNPALFAAAARRGGVVGVYLACPEEWEAHDDAPVKVGFWRRNLEELSAALARMNIALVARRVTRGGMAGELLSIAREHSCTELHFNAELEVNEARRNERVRGVLERAGVRVHAHTDQTLVSPDRVRTGEGRPFSVFTPFRRALYRALAERPVKALGEPSPQTEMIGTPSEVGGVFEGYSVEPDGVLWPAGEWAAHRRLETFLDAGLSGYKAWRDVPGVEGTSGLSPYLAAGVVSIRQCLSAALERTGGRLESGDAGADQWVSELAWREFYRHVLAGYPRVCMGRAFKAATDRIAWRDDTRGLEAWKNGMTGVPIVDAGMRQLAATGWMHNRVRMITAMFLTKDLFIDWREGERHFMRHLIDGDLASNNGGWQWSASTGTDAAPYFRMFNPVSQSKKCDPDGAYIRKWVTELRGVQGDEVHDPSVLGTLELARLGYPEAIRDHGASRKRVLAAFGALRAGA